MAGDSFLPKQEAILQGTAPTKVVPYTRLAFSVGLMGLYELFVH
jgi:hypothetical protein